MSTTAEDTRAAQKAVDEQGFWYHTMEVAPGVVTPGWFDLRPIVDRLPWPDVAGKRCLDVGPYDGFLSFELERRGAAEVVAADIGSHTEWDFPYAARARGPQYLAWLAGPEVGSGFRVAKELLGSRVERVDVNAYDLSPERVGTFDVVVCGSLMLHLRDPVRALEAIRGVCGEKFLSAETINLPWTVAAPRRALARMHGGERTQWLVPNLAGHRLLLEASGFEVLDRTRPYAIPLGRGHPARSKPFRDLPRKIARSLIAGGTGVPHSAALCRPLGP